MSSPIPDPSATMPPEAPLDMPVQRLRGRRPGQIEVLTSVEGMFSRRVLLILLTLVLAAAASSEVRLALLRDGIDTWDLVLLLLFFPLFGWIAFGFVGAATGFVLMMTHRHPGFVPAPEPRAPLIGRTAVLVPIHNEDVDAVFGRIRTMLRSLEEAGAADAFAVFVLSDSAASGEAGERAAWADLAATSPSPLFYRRRAENVGRKPGNIADWVRRHGAAWDYMLVLDADSLMSGRAMIGMASIMDKRPSVGLLQTVPSIIGAATLFQRWMQFASRLYGPLSSAGLIWWSGAESTFWGHNALLRTRAFAQSCGLPDLPGPPPLGGPIMSHDMVEAALLRRRGWAAHMVMIAGSYEEFPPTMIDHAMRDRRWAQGNLQHLRLLDMAGLHWVSRLQLLIGASAYVTSPAWAMLILTTLGQAIASPTHYPGIEPPPYVLALTVLLLFGPRLLAILWAMTDGERRASFGGGRAILRSVAVELPLSVLMAPATMVTQTIDLVGLLAGRSSGWQPQDRDRDGMSWRDALRRYRWHLVVGALLLACSPAAPVAALWLAPVIAGLFAAPALAYYTASRRTGARLDAAGVFRVPKSSLEPYLPADTAGGPHAHPVRLTS